MTALTQPRCLASCQEGEVDKETRQPITGANAPQPQQLSRPLPPCLLPFSEVADSALSPPAEGDDAGRAIFSTLTSVSLLTLSPPGTMVIVSGWGKQFLQRLPENLMEVGFNSHPTNNHHLACVGPLPCVLPALGFGGLEEGNDKRQGLNSKM